MNKFWCKIADAVISYIRRQAAIYIIIAIKGPESFESRQQLACYAGVVLFLLQSRTSIRKQNKGHPLANKRLKHLLNMYAIIAIRYDKEFKTYYEKKQMRKI